MIVSVISFCFTCLIKNTIVFMNSTWPSNTGLEFPDQKYTFCPLAEVNLRIWNLKQYSASIFRVIFWISSFFLFRFLLGVFYLPRQVSTSLSTRA